MSLTVWHDLDIGCDEGLPDPPEPVIECDLHAREAIAPCRVCGVPLCEECGTRCLGPGTHWFHAASEKCGFWSAGEAWCFVCHRERIQDPGNMHAETTNEKGERICPF